MNSNKYNNLLQKYYDGLTTVAEESWLKENALDGEQLPLTILSEEKIEMDWNFDDLKNAAKASELKPKTVLLRPVKWMQYAAAVVLLLSLATWAYIKVDRKKSGDVLMAGLPAIEKPVMINRVKLIEQTSTPPENKLQVVTVEKTKVLLKNNNSVPKKEAIAPQKNDDFFVMVNGVRITNENEAMDILQQSLVSISGNVKQTMNGINNSSKLDVKFK